MSTVDTSHECPAPECGRRVSSGRLACTGHWYQLPKHMRDEIWAAWRARGVGYGPALDRHRVAIAAAMDFWRNR